MATIIRTQGLSISPELRGHLLRRFTFALYRFEKRITQVEVFVKELNSGRAGLTRNVLVRIGLSGREGVVVQATAHDHFSAVNIAARRCKRAIRRATKETMEHRRSVLDHAGAGKDSTPAGTTGISRTATAIQVG